MTPLKDGYDRTISYLRLSITDRCNLRCRYCMPAIGVNSLDHREILSYEELTRLTRLALEMQVSKVRLTGGEPLVRKGVVGFVRQLKEIQVPDIRLTTNGLLLADMAEDLYQAGATRVNVSLDTLDPQKYKAITRCGRLDKLWAGLDAAQRAGFDPIKINVVLIRGVNDEEIEAFGRLSLETPYDIRFIEYMPQTNNGWRPGLVVTEEEITSRLSALGEIEQLPARVGDGPARSFRIKGARGRLGVITPVSNHFCPACNRMRITADGKLLTCLYSKKEIDLKTPLRSGVDDQELRRIIRQAIKAKEQGHTLSTEEVCNRRRPMGAIGG